MQCVYTCDGRCKRRAVEAIAVGVTRAPRENAAIEISRDRSVTNRKPASAGLAISGETLVAGGGIEPPTLGL